MSDYENFIIILITIIMALIMALKERTGAGHRRTDQRRAKLLIN